MEQYLTIFLITLVTGAGGLALGAALAAAIHNPSSKMTSALLRFTAGVMLSVVCFDLIGDAAEGEGIFPVVLWLLIGFCCTYLLNCLIDRGAHHGHSHGHGEAELYACGRRNLRTAGLVLAAAVALHNMPVGMAIGATFAGEAAAGHSGEIGRAHV